MRERGDKMETSGVMTMEMGRALKMDGIGWMEIMMEARNAIILMRMV